MKFEEVAHLDLPPVLNTLLAYFPLSIVQISSIVEKHICLSAESLLNLSIQILDI